MISADLPPGDSPSYSRSTLRTRTFKDAGGFSHPRHQPSTISGQVASQCLRHTAAATKDQRADRGPRYVLLYRFLFSTMLICLRGPVKLGVPDDREPEYTRYFVQAPVSELTSAHPVPDQLTVPASPTTDLTILVDFASTVSAPLGSVITSCTYVTRPPNLHEEYIYTVSPI